MTARYADLLEKAVDDDEYLGLVAVMSEPGIEPLLEGWLGHDGPAVRQAAALAPALARDPARIRAVLVAALTDRDEERFDAGRLSLPRLAALGAGEAELLGAAELVLGLDAGTAHDY